MTGFISDVRFSAARADQRDHGLAGWVRLTVVDLVVLDGIALRRRPDGTLELRFPSRVDHRGARHPIVHPLDAAARRAIEAAVLAALSDLLPKEQAQ